MPRILKWCLAAVVLGGCLPSVRQAQAQCVVCGASKIVKHVTCQPSTTGAKECSIDYTEELGWVCAPLGQCGPTALQVDGGVIQLAHLSTAADRPLETSGADSATGDRTLTRSCDGAVVRREYTMESRDRLKSRSALFEL